MIFIHKGREIAHHDGKYPIWVRDTWLFQEGLSIKLILKRNRLLYVESFRPIYTPKRYKMNQVNI
jgi:homogentisate 1,2-dioxygenase